MQGLENIHFLGATAFRETGPDVRQKPEPLWWKVGRTVSRGILKPGHREEVAPLNSFQETVKDLSPSYI